MAERRDPELVADLREAIDRIERYVAGMRWEVFREDTRTQDAVIRNLEILGEAAKACPPHSASGTTALPGARSPACAIG